MSGRAQPHDPTARAVLNKQHHDPIGTALARLTSDEARCFVANAAYGIPAAALALEFGHDNITVILERARVRLRAFLIESDECQDIDDIDWASSPAVRKIGEQLELNQPQPCQYCGNRTLDAITRKGRPRQYCSNACRQAAYRYRSHATTAADDYGRLLTLPVLWGFESRIQSDARWELLRFHEAKAITLERVPLPADTAEEPDLLAALGRRWRRDSPLRRAGLAALAQLKGEGIAPAIVRLHRPRIWAGQHQYKHAVGFECRYLPSMATHFDDGGIEWLEIPRTSRSGALVGLWIRAVAWERIGPRREHTYFA